MSRFTPTTTAEVRTMTQPPEPRALKSIGKAPSALTWEDCVQYEPRLLHLVRRIETIKDKNEELKGKRTLRYGYAHTCWYGYTGHSSIKEELNKIIGWSSDNPYKELRGHEAHGLCYHYLFDLLSS